MTDASVGFRSPGWCPSGWAPTWRLRTNLYKFGEKASPHILQKKNCSDLNFGDSLCIVTFFLFSDSGLHLLNSFDFYFEWVTLKTSNRYSSEFERANHIFPLHSITKNYNNNNNNYHNNGSHLFKKT